MERVGKKSRLYEKIPNFSQSRIYWPTFCQLFQKIPDFVEFFNFWTLADLIPTSTFSTMLKISESKNRRIKEAKEDRKTLFGQLFKIGSVFWGLHSLFDNYEKRTPHDLDITELIVVLYLPTMPCFFSA